MFDLDVKTILRVGLGLTALVCVILAKKIVGLVGNKTLLVMAQKMFLFFLFVFFARLVAAWFDYALEFEVGVFSSLITYGFNLYIVWILYKLYRKLKFDEIALHKSTGETIIHPNWVNKPRLSVILDDMFSELKVNMKKTREIGETLAAEAQKHQT